MSAKIDFILNKHIDFGENYIWKDSQKVPIPMQNWQALLEMREAPNLAPQLTLTEEAGITLGDTDGTILVEITNTQVDSLSFRTGLYTLKLTDTLGATTLFSAGTATVLRGE